MRSFITMDYTTSLKRWYDAIVSYGGMPALAYPFSNYTPPYLYLLILTTRLNFLHPLVAIKLVSVIFDFITAFVVFKIMRLHFVKGWVPFGAALLLLLTPTIFINSALWGQCDIIYTLFLLAFLFFTLQDRPWLAMVCFAVAFSFKLQAIFLLPFILIQILRHKTPWYSLFLVPLVYFVMIIPAWIEGRPLLELLLIYKAQAFEGSYFSLSMNAANPFIFFPDTLYNLFVPIGTGIAVLAGVWMALVAFKHHRMITHERLILEATTILTLMPFLLPRMHERYFFPAAAFMLLLLWYKPRFFWVAALFQLTNFLSYIPFLYMENNQNYPVMIAVVGNCFVLFELLREYLRAEPVAVDSIVIG